MEINEQQTLENNARKEKETDIIKRALRATYQNLDDKSLQQVTREVTFAPHDRKIELGGRKVSASDLRFQVANTIENLGTSKTLEQALDLQMMIANSIENINSETSSSQEYFRWLDDTTDILKHMNDGYVSDEDLSERNEFLDMTNQREAELMLCLGMYQGSRHPQAHEQAKIIQYKLTKLREMRTAIEMRTRDKADVEISREEYDLAVPYYKLYKGLAALPFGYDLPRDQKIRLGISHDDDDDLEPHFNHYDHLLNVVLDHMKELDSLYASHEYQLAYDLAHEDKTPNVKEISDKMKELSGRKNSFRVHYDILNREIRQRSI